MGFDRAFEQTVGIEGGFSITGRGEGMDDQEKYLKESSFWQIILRGLKKLITEMTSVKFLLLVFICIGIWQKFIQDSIGLGTALLIIGIREVPVDAIIGKLTGGLK